MEPTCSSAFIHGYERMAAWSDLLDQINVFPVADADTGRNLKISLAPLRQLDAQPKLVPAHLVRMATGNSGNIAAAFFYELLAVERASELPGAIQRGMQKARQSVADPQPGTMLTIFDALAEVMPPQGLAPSEWDFSRIIDRLQQTVADSSDALPQLKHAGVVDAGALGMFIFWEAFLSHITGRQDQHRPVTELFGGKLTVAADWAPEGAEEGFCVSATIRTRDGGDAVRRKLADNGESVVVTDDAEHVRVHLHTEDRDTLRSGLEAFGPVVGWSEERIVSSLGKTRTTGQAVHIMTDAAGSITTEDARELGVTLLSSYLVVGEQAWPETLYEPGRLYAAMSGGIKVSTAQASVFERHQSYLSAISRFPRVLYLCVGSVYTGNYEIATTWKAQNPAGDRLAIIDTGAASGRLGVVVLATARFSRETDDPQTVMDYARNAVARSQEFVFLDQLKYLAAGGRISKTKGFFGDLLHKKPIITPTAHGAANVGIVRNRKEQLAFALAKIDNDFTPDAAPDILLQYTDNQSWVQEVAAGQIQERLPSAKIQLRPLSLTSGAHMGPGTWGLAYLPRMDS